MNSLSAAYISKNRSPSRTKVRNWTADSVWIGWLLVSIDGFGPIHLATMLNLHLSEHELGSVIHFNVPVLKERVRRFINPRERNNSCLNAEFAEVKEEKAGAKSAS
jgi:hypothetical protein